MSKSNAERIVAQRLNKLLRLEVNQNTRPDWLIGRQGERLELDFYLPQLAIAIEIQGEQHARFVPHFHRDYQGFKDQQRRDADKKKTCEKAGIQLLEIWAQSEIDNAIKLVEVQYRRWLTLPQSKTGAYKLIFTHMLAIWKKPKRAQEEQRQSLIRLIATEWKISLREVTALFEPRFKGVLKQAVNFQKNGLTKQRHVNTLRELAIREGMSEHQAEMLMTVISSVAKDTG